MKRSLMLVPCLSAALLVGCVSVDNDAVTLGPTVVLPTFAEQGRDVPAMPSDSPSNPTLGQRTWEPTYFLVEEKNVWHTPVYTTPVDGYLDSTARSRGDFPSEMTALQDRQRPHGKAVFHAMSAPFVAAGDAIMLLPRMVFEACPTSVQDSPKRGFERFSRGRDALAHELATREPSATIEPSAAGER